MFKASIDDKEVEVNKMKCCGNCKHGDLYADDCDTVMLDKCNRANGTGCWELAE